MNNNHFNEGTSTRVGYVDALKGFAILCVVLGHIANGYINAELFPEAKPLLRVIYNGVYSFHMPLFMMISGYVYRMAYFNDKGEPDRKRLNQQIFNQIGVYVIFSIALGLTKILASSSVNNEVKLIDIALIPVKPIYPYWYIYVLLIFYLFFSVKKVLLQNKWVLFGLFLSLAVCGQLFSVKLFELNGLLYYGLFFYIGASYREHKNWIIGNKLLSSVLFYSAVAICVTFWNRKYINDIFVLNIVVALGFSLALWYIFEHIPNVGSCTFFRFIGKYCLEIYVIHCFFTAGLRVVFLKAGVNNVYLSVLLNLIISTAVPCLFSKFCRKFNIHGLFFKPYTYFLGSNTAESIDGMRGD